MSEALFTPATTADHLEADWPPEIGHISASGLKMLAACPEQYRRRYLKGEKGRPGAALVWGRADHAAIEANYAPKVASGVDLPTTDVIDVFAAELDQAVEESGGVDEIDWGKDAKGKTGARKAAGETKDRGVLLVTAYREQVCPVFQPEAVEEQFSVTVPAIPVPIIGYLDLVGRDAPAAFTVEDAPQSALKIVDRKTSSRTAKTPNADWRVQAGIYMLHRWLPHEWHLSVKTKEPKIVTPTTEPGLVLKPSPLLKRQIEMQMSHLARQLAFYYVTYGPDETWPGAILHDWRCSFCFWKDDGNPPCEFWHRPQDVARRKNGAT